jgi:hypothetical protein
MAAQEAAAANADPAGEVELGFEGTGKGLRQDLEVFSRVYEAILDNGGNRLLIDTRETRKELDVSHVHGGGVGAPAGGG